MHDLLKRLRAASPSSSRVVTEGREGFTRRSMLRGSAMALLLGACGVGDGVNELARSINGLAERPDALPEAPPSTFPLSIASGDATAEQVSLWTQYRGTTALFAAVWEMLDDTVGELVAWTQVTATGAGFAQLDVDGLVPDRAHRFAFVEVEGNQAVRRSPLGRFRDDFRARWAQNLATEGYRRLRASTSLVATWDDHEISNNWNPEKGGLAASPCTFKVILNSVPVTNFPGLFDFVANDRWEGYASARTEILSFIDNEHLGGVLWVSGDFHLGSAGRVSPSGLGSNAIEVLAGPGAQSANPLLWTLAGNRQFDYVTGTNNTTAFALDPSNRRATVTFHNGAGATVATRSYVL